MKEVFKRSQLLFNEYLATVPQDEFLELYDSVETYQGKTVDEWLEGKQRAAHSSHILVGVVDMSWLTEATEEQLKEADEIAKSTWKKGDKENGVPDYRLAETDGLERESDSEGSK